MTPLKPLCFLPLLLIGCEREKPSKIGSSEINGHVSATDTSQVTDSQSDAGATPPSNTDGKRIQKRELKQKYPELVKLPEPSNPTVERLNREIKGINANDPAFAKKLNQLWNESVAKLTVESLPSAKDAEVAKGSLLPKEIAPTLKATAARTDDGSADAMLCIVAAWSAMTRDELLVEFAERRSNNLPPSSSDIAIFDAMNRSLEELGPIQKKSPFEPWKRFADSTNPIYRLLALRAATYTTSQGAWNLSSETDEFNRIDASAKLGFYLSYLDEKDPVILTEAIQSLATVPLSEARQAIEKFHTQQLERGDTALIQAAEEALRSQELTSKGTK